MKFFLAIFKYELTQKSFFIRLLNGFVFFSFCLQSGPIWRVRRAATMAVRLRAIRSKSSTKCSWKLMSCAWKLMTFSMNWTWRAEPLIVSLSELSGRLKARSCRPAIVTKAISYNAEKILRWLISEAEIELVAGPQLHHPNQYFPPKSFPPPNKRKVKDSLIVYSWKSFVWR